MSSVVSICNSALIKIGADRISSLTEDSKEAQLCNEQYEKLRDEVLRAHPWNFAIKRAELGKLADAPLFEYSNQFFLPNDCVKVLKLENIDAVYKIEGRSILTNESTVKIQYISRELDVTKYDPIFQEALALRLATELAYPLLQSASLQQAMEKSYLRVLKDARSMDGQEGTPDNLIRDEWLLSRY